MNNFIKICSLLGLLALAGACSSDDKKEEVKPPESVDVLYNRARDDVAQQKYKAAVKDFEEVERQHPYSEWAKSAQVMSAYASYTAGDFDTAIGTLERFVKMHPGNASAPYAYYLIALCYYEQISDVGRDQKITQQALQALSEVISRFPDTEYARDAKLKMDLTVDHLAGKEMTVGRYYQRQQEYVAAINRFKYVVDHYQTTSHIPEALHRLVECYLQLGVKDEAQKYAAVLGYNYPGSEWYSYSYAMMQGKDLPQPTGVKNTLKRWFTTTN